MTSEEHDIAGKAHEEPDCDADQRIDHAMAQGGRTNGEGDTGRVAPLR